MITKIKNRIKIFLKKIIKEPLITHISDIKGKKSIFIYDLGNKIYSTEENEYICKTRNYICEIYKYKYNDYILIHKIKRVDKNYIDSFFIFKSFNLYKAYIEHKFYFQNDKEILLNSFLNFYHKEELSQRLKKPKKSGQIKI